MKKTTKFLLGAVLGILLLTPVSQVNADWQRDNVGWWYSLNNGSYYKNTGANIDRKWYRFDDRGYMMTGWQPIAELNYTSRKKINWSYFDPVNGDKKFGWQNIDGKWYNIDISYGIEHYNEYIRIEEGKIPKYFLLSDEEYYKKYIVSKIGMKNKNTKMKVYNCDKNYSRSKLKNIFRHIKNL